MAGLELEQLYKDECPHCRKESLTVFIESGYFLNAASTLKEVIRDVSSGSDDAAHAKLFDLYNANYQKGIREVFKPGAENKKYLDYLYKFEANTAKFAAYKSKYAVQVLRKSLDEQPDAYDKNAKAILNTFNHWQNTEYNTLVARCRTARQFTNFEANKDLYQNLEWLRTRSADPRELHLSFVGLIFPIGHPFFKENQPGNLYNCKCNLRQTDKPATSEEEYTTVPAAKGLEGNPYTTREIFTEKHPYYAKVESTPELEAFIERQVYKQFEKTDVGYFIHPLQNKKMPDFNDLKAIAKLFNDQGAASYIMPKLDVSRGDLYRYLYEVNGAYKYKCPDLLIGDFFFEYESFSGSYSHTKLSNMLSRAVKQSDCIIIDVRGSKDSAHYFRRRIFERIEKGQSIKKVYLFRDGNILEEIL